MYPIDFISSYPFENFDFELENEKLDFSLDGAGSVDFIIDESEIIDFTLNRFEIIDFQLDLSTPVEEYIPIFNQLKPVSDDVVAYTENYLTTEDSLPINAEDGYHLIY